MFPIKPASAQPSSWESDELPKRLNKSYHLIWNHLPWFLSSVLELILLFFNRKLNYIVSKYFLFFLQTIIREKQNIRTCARGSSLVELKTLVCGMGCTSSELIWTLCKCTFIIRISTEQWNEARACDLWVIIIYTEFELLYDWLVHWSCTAEYRLPRKWLPRKTRHSYSCFFTVWYQ